MAELTPPRRDEPLTVDGVPTLRFSEWLEDSTDSTNSGTSDNEVVNSVASASPAQLASVLKQLANLELQQDTGSAAALSQIFKRLNDIEMQPDNTAMLARVFKRLNDIETTQAASDAVGVNTAIKSTFDRRYALLVS